MNKLEKRIVVCVVLGAIILLPLVGCNDLEMAEAAAKYTDQTARAIIESGWKISGSIILGAVINGFMS